MINEPCSVSSSLIQYDHNLPNSNQGSLENRPQILVKGVGVGNGSYAPASSDFYHHVVGTSLAMFDPSMAEHESRESRGNNPSEETPASGPKGFRGQDRGEDEEDEGWLQLSIGGHTCRDHKGRNKSGDGRERSILAARGSMELDPLPLGRGSGGASINKLEATSSVIPTIRPVSTTASSPLLFHHHFVSGGEFRLAIHGQGLVGGTGAPISNSSYPSSSSLSMPYAMPYFGQPLHLQKGGADCVAGPSTDVIKIIDPPRRPHSGIWFMLLASQNQEKDQPCLPQISKSFLRIKDGRMTVRLLTKYLVNKLQLSRESEIGITCRGQELQPYLTLQHVRDSIWIPRKDAVTTTTSALSSSSSIVTFQPESSTTTLHLMVLHYSRRRRITNPTVVS